MIQETPRGEFDARELCLDIKLHLDSLRTSLVEDGCCTEWRHRMIDTVLMSADAMALQSYEKDIELCRAAALAEEKNAELARSAGVLRRCRNAPLWFEHHALDIAEAVSDELDRLNHKHEGARKEAERLRMQCQASLSSLEDELLERETEVRRLSMQCAQSSAEIEDMGSVVARLQEENLVLEELFSKEHQARCDSLSSPGPNSAPSSPNYPYDPASDPTSPIGSFINKPRRLDYGDSRIEDGTGV